MMTDDEHNGMAAADLMMTDDHCFGHVSTVSASSTGYTVPITPGVYIRCMPAQEPALCQEIGLVAFMFFFELLFSYVPLTISLYVFLTNLSSIILFLIC